MRSSVALGSLLNLTPRIAIEGETMKKLIWIAALAGVAMTAHANEVLVNTGFETGDVSPWVTDLDFSGGTGTAWFATDTDSFTGKWCAENIGNMRLAQMFTPTATTDISSISFALKQPVAINTAYDFIYADGSIDEFLIFEQNGDWNVYDVTANLDPSKTLAGFGIYGLTGTADDRSFVDDIHIDAKAVPEPASMTALAFGALALIRRRRK